MRTSHRHPQPVIAAMFGVAIAAGSVACERHAATAAPQVPATNPAGTVATAFDVWTPSPASGATIPVTLADGRQAYLVIAPSALTAPYAAQPVVLREPVIAESIRTVERAPAPRVTSATRTRSVVQRNRGRSWQKEALIVGGSAGAGALIGGLAGGKKGAAIGAAAAGVGGLVYDLKTRR